MSKNILFSVFFGWLLLNFCSTAVATNSLDLAAASAGADGGVDFVASSAPRDGSPENVSLVEAQTPELLAEAARRYPRTFRDCDGDLFAQVTTFNRQAAQICEQHPDNLHSTPVLILGSALEELGRYIQGELIPGVDAATEAALSDICDDIQDALRIRRSTGSHVVTPEVYFDCHMRMLGALGEPSEAEYSVAKHAVDPHLLTALFQNDAWKTPLKYSQTQDMYNDGERSIGEVYFTSPPVFKIVSDILDRRLPQKRTVFVLGRKKLSVSFMIHCVLNGAYPVGASPAKAGYHGIAADLSTPAAFAVHDMVHKNLDRRTTLLLQHVLEFVEENADASTRSVSEIAEFYAPIALNRYNRVNNFFKFVYHKLLQEILPRGLMEYKRLMAGFFWFMHETILSNELSRVYGDSDICSIVEAMTETSVSSMNEREAWENLDDPLKTDPLDGSVGVSEDEVLKNAHSDFLAVGEDADGVDGDVDGAVADVAVAEAILREFLRIAEITMSPEIGATRFVDVRLNWSGGEVNVLTYPTLYQKFENIADARGLLRWAGIKISKPDLNPDDLEARRATAIAHITRVREGIVRLVEGFRDFCLNYARESSDWETFFRTQVESEQREVNAFLGGVRG